MIARGYNSSCGGVVVLVKLQSGVCDWGRGRGRTVDATEYCAAKGEQVLMLSWV